MSTERNKIQLTYGEKQSYAKYSLEFINYSTEAGYEGRFWKFKVKLSDSQKSDILRGVDDNNRIYKVSGIELSVKSKVTEYPCGQTYTYKGYALGYGSELAQGDTLSCKVDGFEKYLSLDVHSTYYRPKGTNGGFKDCTQDTLHSVYFSVPNEIIDEYGEMTAVHATWLNALTDIMLVTGNSTIYNHMTDYVGVDTGQSWDENWNDDVNYAFITEYDGLSGATGDLEGGDIAYNPAIALKGGSLNGTYGYDGFNRLLTRLDYIFYAENGNADDYCLSSETILDWLAKYTSLYGGELVNGKYSAELFEKVDSEFTDITITADDKFTLTSNEYTVEWYNKYLYTWFGAYSEVKTTIYDVNAIQAVTRDDMDNALSETAFCNNFYVAESDYDELYGYVKTAKSREETVYLFRYYQSDYWAAEVSEGEPKKYMGITPLHNQIDTNAYFAQEWLQLDFDIIDLTFTKNGVDTVIPVIMSPMDIAADGTPPLITTPDGGLTWWQILLGIIGLILIIWLLLKFAPLIVYCSGKVIVLPFKAIGNVVKRRKEKKRLEFEEKAWDEYLTYEHYDLDDLEFYDGEDWW